MPEFTTPPEAEPLPVTSPLTPIPPKTSPVFTTEPAKLLFAIVMPSGTSPSLRIVPVMLEPFVTLIARSFAPAGSRKFPVKAVPFATPGVNAVAPVFVSTRSSEFPPSGTSFAVTAFEKKPKTGRLDGALSASVPVAVMILEKTRVEPAAKAPLWPAAATEVRVISPALTVGKLPAVAVLFTWSTSVPPVCLMKEILLDVSGVAFPGALSPVPMKFGPKARTPPESVTPAALPEGAVSGAPNAPARDHEAIGVAGKIDGAEDLPGRLRDRGRRRHLAHIDRDAVAHNSAIRRGDRPAIRDRALKRARSHDPGRGHPDRTERRRVKADISRIGDAAGIAAVEWMATALVAEIKPAFLMPPRTGAFTSMAPGTD